MRKRWGEVGGRWAGGGREVEGRGGCRRFASRSLTTMMKTIISSTASRVIWLGLKLGLGVVRGEGWGWDFGVGIGLGLSGLGLQVWGRAGARDKTDRVERHSLGEPPA